MEEIKNVDTVNEYDINSMDSMEDMALVEESSGYGSLAAFGGLCAAAGAGIALGVTKLVKRHKEKKLERQIAKAEKSDEAKHVKVDRKAVDRLKLRHKKDEVVEDEE